MAEEAKPKWEGKATAKLKGLAASQVWPLLEDFCSFNKWIPTIDTCYQVEGVNGQPGLFRYCAATISSSSDGSEKSIKWCHEKLLEIDPIQRCLSYEVLDNNLGFKSSVSKMEVLPTDGDEQHGCEIEWSFVADPVEGLTFEGLLAYFDSSLQGVAENMEKALLST
ncbi:unnamed protein product [Ilex paraguariensis]|uniref:Lachrymatory factor synthase n=1 Tax=Ilex paraguariensis TaxID=185542 RepID=A0ABC8UJ34_9AQUA